MTLRTKMTMSDLQQYPEKLCLVKYELNYLYMFIFIRGFFTKVTCAFLANIESMEKLSEKQKNDIFDQIKGFGGYHCKPF